MLFQIHMLLIVCQRSREEAQHYAVIEICNSEIFRLNVQ